MAGQSRIYKLNILADTKGLVDGLNKANQQVTGASGNIGAAFKKIGVAVAAAGVAAGAFAVALGKASIAEAIQAEAENNRLATILKNTGATEQQIEALNAQADALERVGVVSGGNIKVVQSQLATFDLSTSAIQRLTPAILDYVTAEKGANASSDDFRSATNGLAQALNGNFASLTKVGFVLDETTKAQISNGTEAERAAAIVDVLNSTYEGFNETLTETAEGRLIQLQNQFDQIKERIGNVLLPVLVALSKYFVDNILPVIDRLVAGFEKNASPALDKFKKVVVDFVLPALKNLWSFITEFVVPTVRNLLTPVIELLQAAFVFLSNKIKENREGLDTFIAIALKLAGFVRDTVAPILGGILATAFNLVVRAVGQAIDNFSKVFEIIGKVARFFGMDFDTEVTKATKTVNNLNTGTVDAYKSFAEQSRTIVKDVIPSIGSLTTSTNGLASSNNALAGSTRAVTAAMKEQFTAAQAIDLIRAGFGSEFGVTGPGTLAGGESIRSAAEIISQFGGKIKGFNSSPTDPYFGFGQGSDIRTFQRGQGAVQAGNVTINVNGTVIDPEGAARAIASVISNSVARVGSLPFVPALAFE